MGQLPPGSEWNEENVVKHWLQVTSLKCLKSALFPDVPDA